jgi:hypothetical protein
MKYQLETIPIWEAYEDKGECPLCFLHTKLTKNYTGFFLGGSVMEPNIRGRVNEVGFCGEHFSLLFAAGNKQALALMAHTRLLTLGGTLRARTKKLLQSELDTKSRAFLPKKREESKAVEGFVHSIGSESRGCAFCETLDHTLERYVFTIVYLWKKDEEFRKTVAASKGFCVPHFGRVIRMAESVLSRTHRNRFLTGLLALEEANLARVEEEILWYTQKFDYRNSDKPWKNSEDALQRTIQKLTGRVV